MFVLPTLRRAEPRGLAIAVGVWTFLLIHWLLATVGLVNGWARTGHHYLDLVEALAIVGSVWGLSALAEVRPGWRRPIVVGALLVLASQVWHAAALFSSMVGGSPPGGG